MQVSNRYYNDDLAYPLDDQRGPTLECESEWYDVNNNSMNEASGGCCNCKMEGPRDSRRRNTEDKTTQCDLPFVNYFRCKKTDGKDFEHYTGVTPDHFEALYEFLGGDAVCNDLKYRYNRRTPRKHLKDCLLSARERLFLTLLRLRRGIPLKDLAYLFRVSTWFASACFYTWIRFLYLQFNRISSQMFLSKEAQANKSAVFQTFPNIRVIIDGAEFRIQRAYHYELQGLTYSSYKSSNTVKFLIGISCFEGTSYISGGFDGSISDKQLVLDSGFLNYLKPGDVVMADRGFNIKEELSELGVGLVIPPFLGDRDHLSAEEELLTKAIARARIYVEVVIGDIKNFRLLRYVIPNKLLPILSDMVFVAGYLTNFKDIL